MQNEKIYILDIAFLCDYIKEVNTAGHVAYGKEQVMHHNYYEKALMSLGEIELYIRKLDSILRSISHWA
jgi:hypothetical protein